MADPSACPPADRLRRLLAGSAPGAEEAELIAHLDQCADCQRRLEELSGAPAELLRAAGAAAAHTAVAEVSLRRVLDDLETSAAATVRHRPPDRSAWVRSLLQPTGVPGTLGRIDDYDVTELLGQGSM